MITDTTELPRWDVESIFPSLDSPAYASAREAWRASLDELRTLFERHGIGAGTPASTDGSWFPSRAAGLSVMSNGLPRRTEIDNGLLRRAGRICRAARLNGAMSGLASDTRNRAIRIPESTDQRSVPTRAHLERMEMNTYVIRRQRAWRSPEELQRVAARSQEVAHDDFPDEIRWIRSYVIAEEGGTLGTVCIYQASDTEAVRRHALRVGMPADEILDVADTVVVRPDPVQEPAAS
jgi:hypothetical protein